MPAYVLGIHDGHNASACLLADGEIVFAVQEERLVGEKNFAGFPAQSVTACLRFASVQPYEIREIAFASHRSTPFRLRAGEQLRAVRREATPTGIARRLLWYPYYRFHSHMGRSQRLRCAQAMGFQRRQYAEYDHHLCHAVTAYYGLRERHEEKYLIVTVDGYGDLDSSTIWINRNGTLERIARTPFTDSLGTIYGITTGAMGFKPLEHEYKLMGMAPYASAFQAQPLIESFRRLLAVDESALRFRRRTVAPSFLYARRLRKLIAGERFDHVCAALQQYTEEMLVKLVSAAVQTTGIRRVLCAGGVFMNVKANKRLTELPQVELLKVFPSCGDETLSMGSAWLAHIATGGRGAAEEIAPIDGFYLGGDVEEEACRQVVQSCGHDVSRYEDVESEVARILASGKPVARCKGRMEFGARALGNRSILADPVNHDVVRVINQMVKKRDFWMPFAPVVSRERMQEYFINGKDLDSPYMMLTFDTRENFRDLIAAVHNADLTARPRVIAASQNPDYYRLLKTFEEITGRGVLLNTSFNLHGFPIVEGPRQAMEVFNSSGLEYLNIGQYLVHKRAAPAPPAFRPAEAMMAGDGRRS